MNGKFDNTTNIKIDELFIVDPHAEFLQEEVLKIDTLMIVEYRNNQCFTYKLEMDNVTITDIKSYELKDSDIERMMPLCTLKIPHNTEIRVSEITD